MIFNIVEKGVFKIIKAIELGYKGVYLTPALIDRISLKAHEFGLVEARKNLQKFSSVLEKEERSYDIIKSKFYEFPLSPFSVNEVFGIVHDLDGNAINAPPVFDMFSDTFNYVYSDQFDGSHDDARSRAFSHLPSHPLFCNVFHQDSKTYVIFSYFKSSASYYDLLFKQMDSGKHEIEEVISNMIIRYTHNFFVSKERYDTLTDTDKSKLNNRFNSVSPFIDKYNLGKKAPLNLFQAFKV